MPFEHLKALVAMSTDVNENLGAPFVEFDLRARGHGSLFAPNISRLPRSSLVAPGSTPGGERTWPPTNGFTFTTWLRVEAYDKASPLPITLLTLFWCVWSGGDTLF